MVDFHLTDLRCYTVEGWGIGSVGHSTNCILILFVEALNAPDLPVYCV